MDPLLPLLLVSLLAFMLGFLLARNTWLSFEGRQMRRDMRTIINQRAELETLAWHLHAQKQRYAKLLGNFRKHRREAQDASKELWGKSPFSNRALLVAHKLRESLKEPPHPLDMNDPRNYPEPVATKRANTADMEETTEGGGKVKR